MESLDGIAMHLAFRDVVLLYPVATVLHVLEEWPRFPRWARRFASPRSSDREYVVTLALAIGTAALGTALGVAVVVHALEVGHNVFKRW